MSRVRSLNALSNIGRKIRPMGPLLRPQSLYRRSGNFGFHLAARHCQLMPLCVRVISERPTLQKSRLTASNTTARRITTLPLLQSRSKTQQVPKAILLPRTGGIFGKSITLKRSNGVRSPHFEGQRKSMYKRSSRNSSVCRLTLGSRETSTKAASAPHSKSWVSQGGSSYDA